MDDSETKAAALEEPAAPAVNGVITSAIDLSHHLNLSSRSRHPSPLKEIIKYMAYDGMVSLAGGLPHPSLFPIHNASFSVSAPNPKEGNIELQISNNPTSTPPLSKFLQYGNCTGNAELRQWCLEFTQQIHRPAYKDYDVLLHPGNTNAWCKVVGLLCEKGDYILCESYTYPSAQALWIPNENFAAPIAMDGEGIMNKSLEETLESWDSTHPGVNRPHVLYLVSVGSNPTGVSMSAERRKQVYNICVRYDVIIVEDDPYFFLQYPEFDLSATSTEYKAASNDEYLSSLIPSFLHVDYQGRVIRLESFSKTLAPGLRLGYFVANPLFTERLLRATEVETQDPSGVSQALVLSLLASWTTSGYITWLQNLRLEYQRRRDWMTAAIKELFDLSPASQFPELRAEGLVAAIEGSAGTRTPIFSFIPPTGGMFLWTKFYFAQNGKYQVIKNSKQEIDPEQAFANKLWSELAEEKVLLTPGYYYHPWQGAQKTSTSARGADPDTSHFRLTFAMTTKEDMELGIERLAKVVRRSWSS
ncbi:aromatic aminotransferase Aro8 [Truncatella angustata]|uniref:Aromatic aminotransferase Aro8 n=1 Tax=Truncatella angustata TaxID=152316 RepID=A0A9P8USS2_9PEZI|nr:aromatic aminotransferase Aro8 [Truncatella angustata]KAH6657578.1 aromatic aminotransferase Aro8 [Truncatella angustata]